MTTNTKTQEFGMLRTALTGNAIFSTLSGIAILIFASFLAQTIGIENKSTLYFIAPGLILFGLSVFHNAKSKKLNLKNVKATIVMDILWVIGSAIVLLMPLGFTNPGKWIIGVVALIVADFAIWQWLGLKNK